MKIRPLADPDVNAVLSLNHESVVALSPLDTTGLKEHRANAAHVVVCVIDGTVAAFAIAYAPGAPYDSINYAWHSARFDDFLYLDRIAVGSAFRRRGIATLLYDDLEARATSRGRMVCEVNFDPPNIESLAFHHARGYRGIGHQTQLDGHTTVMMEKPL